jgi:prepilin-type processing-associated H-X9-DG protein
MPSIHFRHRGHANVAWCDGHISAERMTLSDGPSMEEFEIGWFGPPDNSLFDPF